MDRGDVVEPLAGGVGDRAAGATRRRTFPALGLGRSPRTMITGRFYHALAFSPTPPPGVEESNAAVSFHESEELILWQLTGGDW